MSYDEVSLAVDDLLLKIHVITGWNFPTELDFQKVLVDQFRSKLLEDYAECTLKEVEYAFRNPTGVGDFGKNLNLHIIDQVMQPYLSKRFEVSKREKVLNEQRIYTDEEILNQRREEIETAFQAMKTGHMPLIHIYFKEILVQDELMNDDEKIEDFLVKALATKQNLYIQ